MQVADDVRTMLLGRVGVTAVTRRPIAGKNQAGMSTRRAGEGLRASSHFSDNSIESSVRGLTLGGGSGLYRAEGALLGSGARDVPLAGAFAFLSRHAMRKGSCAWALFASVSPQ